MTRHERLYPDVSDVIPRPGPGGAYPLTPLGWLRHPVPPCQGGTTGRSLSGRPMNRVPRDLSEVEGLRMTGIGAEAEKIDSRSEEGSASDGRCFSGGDPGEGKGGR